MRTDTLIEELLPLLGQSVFPLVSHDRDGTAVGGDFDCAVRELDRLWPLRAGKRWRLCQCLRYDVRGWYWVLDRDGQVAAIDTLDDAQGIGKYGFPTSQLSESTGSAVLAAYLVSKRVRKGGRWDETYGNARPFADEWNRIRALASQDESAFRQGLDTTFGSLVGPNLAASVLMAVPLTPALRRTARVALMGRRFRSPARVATGIREGASRWIGRVVAPTGLVVTVVGPDGTGKSTLADRLPEACRGLFRKHLHIHWRPGVLPRPGALIGSPEADPTAPHARPSHSWALSLGLLAYYWLDSLLGAWTKMWPTKVRSGLVVIERGWRDVAVDPLRYRLEASPSLVRALGRLLPEPDLVLVLEADPEIVASRKTELAENEVARQAKEWRRILRADQRGVFLDSSRTLDELLEDARGAIIRHLEARAVSRVGSGWANLPPGRTRWWIPRGPRNVVGAALRIHQPMTPRGRFGWETSRLVGRLGCFASIPRGAAPPRAARELLSPFLPSGSTFALGRANHHGRFVGLVIGRDGVSIALAKIATDDRGRAALAAEAENLSALGALLPTPLRAPNVLDSTESVLLLEPISWIPRWRSWELPEDVAHALGEFYRTGAPEDHRAGLSHGDFAPWNLLYTEDGWVLVDWESSSPFGPAFFDPFHYLVQSHTLLGRPTGDELLRALSGGGKFGASLAAYAVGAGVGLADAPDALCSYLKMSQDALDPSAWDGKEGLRARKRLLARLGSSD